MFHRIGSWFKQIVGARPSMLRPTTWCRRSPIE